MINTTASPDNILERLEKLERQVQTLLTRDTNLDRMSDLTPDGGDIRAGRFLALSAGDEPTGSDAIGSFMSADGESFGGTIYHMGGVNGGTIQWGANSTTGKFQAGAGAVGIDANGISINGSDTPGLVNSITWSPCGPTGAVQIYADSTNGYLTIGNGASRNISDAAITIVNGAWVITAESITISGGAISPVTSYVKVDTQGSAATDDLTSITGGMDGQLLVLRSVSAARVVTVKDVAGIYIAGDMVLDSPYDTLTLMCISSGNWIERGRSNNQ